MQRIVSVFSATAEEEEERVDESEALRKRALTPRPSQQWTRQKLQKLSLFLLTFHAGGGRGRGQERERGHGGRRTGQPEVLLGLLLGKASLSNKTYLIFFLKFLTKF